jgi:hypothetical protein
MLVHLSNSLQKVEMRTNIEFLISGLDNAFSFLGSENDTNFLTFYKCKVSKIPLHSLNKNICCYTLICQVAKNSTQMLVLWKVEMRTNIEFLISGPDNKIRFPGSENDTIFLAFYTYLKCLKYS